MSSELYRAIAFLDQATARTLSAILMEDETTGALSSAAIEQTDGSWLCEAVYGNEPNPAALADYAEMMLGQPIAFAVEKLPDIDWVAKSLEGLTAVSAGRFMVFGGHQRQSVPANAIGIEIEAAQAFGTGHHATTWGCLVALDRLFKMRRYQCPLDLGCGSGVLAIGMAKHLRTRVLASDIDPLAANITGDNARLNEVGRYVEVVAAANLDHRRFSEIGNFDLIVANILARPLIAIANDIANRMDANGNLVLSGLRIEDIRRVFAAYRTRGFCYVTRIERDGWATLILKGPHRRR